MRFVYCYWMKEDPGGVQEVAPRHAAYWHRLGLPEYAGGPFDDRSGGLISFDAPAAERAAHLVADDPFQRAGLIDDWWLKAWLPQRTKPRRATPNLGRPNDRPRTSTRHTQ